MDTLKDYHLRLLCRPRGRFYLALPSIQRLRWLLPGKAGLRIGAVQLLNPSRFWGKLYKAFVRAGLVRGTLVWIEEEDLASLEQVLARHIGVREVKLAFYLGTPSPYQKLTALVMRPDGKVIAYAKIATKPYARYALHNEHATLTKLRITPELASHIPNVLSFFSWQGAEVLVTGPGPTKPGPRFLGRHHWQWLRLVEGITGEYSSFASSEMWRNVLRTHEEVKNALPTQWKEHYAWALELLEDQLGPQEIPLILAHRDFTPWNTRSWPDGRLYVFDWEFSAWSYTPLYDYFHFQFMRALMQKGVFTPSLPSLWIYNARERGWKRAEMLFLAYIVDVSLFYWRACIAGGRKEEDLVLRQARMVLDAREEWLRSG